MLYELLYSSFTHSTDVLQGINSSFELKSLICPFTGCRPIDQVSVPSPTAFEKLMDTMARDRAHMYLFSV